MDISFIIPPSPGGRKIIRLIDCSHETKADYLWQPCDFMIISSLLAREDHATLIDGTADALSEKVFLGEAARASGDIIFFALSSVCWEYDYECFRKVREMHRNVPVYVTGDIFIEKEYRELILKECDGIVFKPHVLDLKLMSMGRGQSLPGVCTREGQDIFPEGKRASFVSGGFPRHEMFLKKGYRFPFAKHFRFATVSVMWGCPFSCSYCTDSMFPPVVRDYRDILRELEYLTNLGVRELFFSDKTFGYPYSNSYPLLEEMGKRFDFDWACYLQPKIYNRKLLELMHAAGCHTIIIGIDSANFSSLKLYNRNVTGEQVEELVRHADELGMSICADFIIGLEHETEEDVRRTFDYAMKIPIDFASFNIAAPLPGSVIRENAIKKGRLVFGSEGLDTLGRKDVLGNENIDSATIRRLRRNAVLRFYLRPSYLMRRLKKTASWEHFKIQALEMLALFRKA